jgi:hypothetical protein
MTLQDLNMLVLLGARERTIAQYSALFAAAGLRLVRTTPIQHCWDRPQSWRRSLLEQPTSGRIRPVQASSLLPTRDFKYERSLR